MECRYLFKIVISLPLDIYSEVKLLDYMIALFLIATFHSDGNQLTLSTVVQKVFLYTSQALVITCIL